MSGALLLFVLAAQAAAADLPVSLERIRAALAAPPPPISTPSDLAPTFSVQIRGQRPDDWAPIDFGTGGPRASVFTHRPAPSAGVPWGAPPLIAIDVVPIVRAIGRAIGNARRSRAEEAARDDVRHALAEFCAAHACD